MFLRAMCFFFLLFLKTKNGKKPDPKKNIKDKNEKKKKCWQKMEMTLVMKSKNVCLLYLPVISRGINRGGGIKDRLHFN